MHTHRADAAASSRPKSPPRTTTAWGAWVVTVATVALGALASVGATAGCGHAKQEAPVPTVSDAAKPQAVAPTGERDTVASPAAGEPRFDGTTPREAIPPAYRWDLTALFKDDVAWAQGLDEAAKRRKALGAYAGKLGDPAQLEACLRAYFDARLLTNKCTVYASLRFDTAQSDRRLQAHNDRAIAAMQALMENAAFIRREVLGLSDAAYDAALKARPGLGAYKPYLDELRRRRSRVLSADGERALGLLGDNLWAEIDLNELPSDLEKTFQALMTELPLPKIRDAEGKEVQLTLSNYGRYRRSPKRTVREAAVEGLLGTLKGFEATFAGTFGGQVRKNVALARARGYDTALDAYLDKDDLDPAVYHSLISAINAHLAPLHRYVKVRKQALGLADLHLYDLYIPMVSAKVTRTFTYDDARKILPQALEPLGPTYTKILASGLDPAHGWVDVYPHKNKNSGAFVTGVYGAHPFVKLNFFGSYNDLSTVAHEYGHALHTYLAHEAQPYITSDYPPFLAEIASTLNERLLSEWMLDHAQSDEERLALLTDLAESIRTTIYRQALFAEFELAAHTAAEAGKPLTAEVLNGIYEGLLRKYYGPDYTVGPNDGVEWAYVPHFYYKYYVFTYATGLSSGIALADRIKAGGADARDAYLGMLKGGTSRPPLELLKSAGVDLTKPDAIAGAAALLDQTLGQIEQLMAKRGGAAR